MRRVVAVSFLAVALLLIPAGSSDAGSRGGHGSRGFGHHHGFRGHGFGHHHGFRGHGVIVFGPSIWWGPAYPYWWYYPPPYYGYAPPPVVVAEPSVYIEPPAPPPSYWHYCPSARAYYPSVPTCPEVWVKVPPRQQ